MLIITSDIAPHGDDAERFRSTDPVKSGMQATWKAATGLTQTATKYGGICAPCATRSSHAQRASPRVVCQNRLAVLLELPNRLVD